jgi:hypothetical protein
MGFFDSIKNFASNVYNKAKGIASELYNRGSTLITGGHYLGPWNSLDPEYIRTHPPVDEADRGGLVHDLEYEDIARRRKAGQLDVAEANRLTRESDNKFLRTMREQWTTSPWKSTLGYLGIKGKNVLEDAGILNPNLFVRQKYGGIIKYHHFDMTKPIAF